MRHLILLMIAGYLITCSFLCQAQLCTGSLGDPIKTIDFGSGTATHGSALGNDFTSYTYSSANFPNDGTYTIENTTAGAGNVWWSTTDHTGNAGGYMMVVNASVSKTDYFYKSSITGLCPGTTYEFAAWIGNLLRSQDNSPPNITFRIERTTGELINSYTTGSIPLNTSGFKWTQYGFYFTMPSDASDIVIRMVNNSNGGAPANDLALDDITFRPCGPILTSSINNNTTSLEVCAGNTTQVELYGTNAGGYTNPQYQWQINTGSGWTDLAGATTLRTTYTISSTASGTYQFRLEAGEAATFASAQCRVASNVSTITIDSAPSATAGSNGPLCAGSTLNLTATGGATYAWTGPNNFTSTSQSPIITGITTAAAGTYTVTVTTTAGCKATAQTTVAVNTLPIAKASASQASICLGNSTMLTASGGSTYLWFPATGLSSATSANPVATPAATTKYIVTASNGTCTDTASVTITVLQNATANAGAEKKIVAGQSVVLNGSVGGSYTAYYWTPATYLDDASKLNPIATPPADITYTLNAISAYCNSAVSTVFVKVNAKIIIPNTFSPNGDGVNDVWNIDGLDSYTQSVITIYNRYGSAVFQSLAYPKPWDGTFEGKNLPAGTYYYVIDLKTEPNKLSGWIALIR